jgi:hypothetical protein
MAPPPSARYQRLRHSIAKRMRMSPVVQPLCSWSSWAAAARPRAGRSPPDPGGGRYPDRLLHRTGEADGGQGSPSTASPATSEAPRAWWAVRSLATPSATSCWSWAASALTLSENGAAWRCLPTGAATPGGGPHRAQEPGRFGRHQQPSVPLLPLQRRQARWLFADTRGRTDFRGLQASYASREAGCVFCALEASGRVQLEKVLEAVHRRCRSGDARAQPGDPAAAWIRWVGVAPAGVERGGGAWGGG